MDRNKTHNLKSDVLCQTSVSLPFSLPLALLADHEPSVGVGGALLLLAAEIQPYFISAKLASRRSRSDLVNVLPWLTAGRLGLRDFSSIPSHVSVRPSVRSSRYAAHPKSSGCRYLTYLVNKRKLSVCVEEHHELHRPNRGHTSSIRLMMTTRSVLSLLGGRCKQPLEYPAPISSKTPLTWGRDIYVL